MASYLYAQEIMTTLLNVPLNTVTTSSFQDLQAKYPDARLRIEADNVLYNGPMDEAQFWAVLEHLDWDETDSYSVLQPAVEVLSGFSKADICAFYDLLHQKLHALDGIRFAEQLGSNRYVRGQYFSVDDFFYARCGVVAHGRPFYEEVLRNPEQMPKEFTFEALLNLPNKAWQAKTGEQLEYYPEVWAETFSNAEGWPGIKTIKERILKPR